MATNRKHDVFNSYQISSLDTGTQPTTEGSQPHAHEGQLALTIKHTVEFSSNRHAPTPTLPGLHSGQLVNLIRLSGLPDLAISREVGRASRPGSLLLKETNILRSLQEVGSPGGSSHFAAAPRSFAVVSVSPCRADFENITGR